MVPCVFLVRPGPLNIYGGFFLNLGCAHPFLDKHTANGAVFEKFCSKTHCAVNKVNDARHLGLGIAPPHSISSHHSVKGMAEALANTQVCSPLGEANFKKYKTCFDSSTITHLVKIHNGKYPGEAIDTSSLPRKQLQDLRKSVKKHSGTSAKRAAELDLAISEHLGASALPDVAKNFRPRKPGSWKSKPREWLTNFDIDAVMAQYNSMPEFKYRFLGVFPVDFAEPLASLGGGCYIPQMCELRLADMVAAGVKYTGFIINLDKHDQPGSHWTSIFAVLDPKLPSYGAYYYDSIGRQWPPEIERYLKRWKVEMDSIKNSKGKSSSKPFKLEWSHEAHQSANTECGMFSMLFQIMWIERLLYDEKRRQNKAQDDEREAKVLAKNGKLTDAAKRLLLDKRPTSFDMIVEMPLKDMNAFYLRDVLYRGGKK